MAKIKTLRRCSLFRALSYRELAILAPYMKEETIQGKAWLAEEGKPTRGLVVLKSGRAVLSAAGLEGERLEIQSGDFFGELSLVDGDQSRAVAAQALEPCEFLRLDPREYHTLCAHAPEVAGKLAQGVLQTISQKAVGMRKVLSDLLGGGKRG